MPRGAPEKMNMGDATIRRWYAGYIEKIARNIGALTDYEREFFRDSVDALEMFGERTQVTVKQWNFMKNLAEKVG